MKKHDFDALIIPDSSSSKKWGTYPQDVIPMWIADTDFQCPAAIVEAVSTRAAQGMFGYPLEDNTVAEAACHWMDIRFGWKADPAWAAPTLAVLPGLALAIEAFSTKGEGVLIQTPVYPPFHSLIEQAGRRKVCAPLIEEKDGWSVDFETFEALCADPALTLFIMCNPHNPTGKVFTREELQRMGEICLRHGVRIIADEIHCDITHPPHKHIPIASLSPELGEASIVFINPCKTFNTPGLRCAVSFAPGEAMRQSLAATTFRLRAAEPNTFGPLALVTAYTACAPYADAMRAYVGANVDSALAFIQEHIPGITVHRPQGTYMLWLDCRGLGMSSQTALNDFFLSKAKVALNSGTDFGQEGLGFMRMNVACRRSTLQEALERLEKATKSGT